MPVTGSPARERFPVPVRERPDTPATHGSAPILVGGNTREATLSVSAWAAASGLEHGHLLTFGGACRREGGPAVPSAAAGDVALEITTAAPGAAAAGFGTHTSVPIADVVMTPVPLPVEATAPDVVVADAAPAEVAPADVAPAEVAPVDVAPAEVAPVDVAPAQTVTAAGTDG